MKKVFLEEEVHSIVITQAELSLLKVSDPVATRILNRRRKISLYLALVYLGGECSWLPKIAHVFP